MASSLPLPPSRHASYTPYTPYSSRLTPLLSLPRRMEPSVTASASAAPSSAASKSGEQGMEGDSVEADNNFLEAASCLAASLGRIASSARKRGASAGPAPSPMLSERAARRQLTAPYLPGQRRPLEPSSSGVADTSITQHPRPPYRRPSVEQRIGERVQHPPAQEPSPSAAAVGDDFAVPEMHAPRLKRPEAKPVEYDGVPVITPPPPACGKAPATGSRPAAVGPAPAPQCRKDSAAGSAAVVPAPVPPSSPRDAPQCRKNSAALVAPSRQHRRRHLEASRSFQRHSQVWSQSEGKALPTSASLPVQGLAQEPDPDVVETERAIQEHALQLRRRERRRRKILEEAGASPGGPQDPPDGTQRRLRSSRSTRRMSIDGGEKDTAVNGNAGADTGAGQRVRRDRRPLESVLSWGSDDNDLLKEIGAAVAASRPRQR